MLQGRFIIHTEQVWCPEQTECALKKYVLQNLTPGNRPQILWQMLEGAHWQCRKCPPKAGGLKTGLGKLASLFTHTHLVLLPVAHRCPHSFSTQIGWKTFDYHLTFVPVSSPALPHQEYFLLVSYHISPSLL